jgi:RNA polymerase sigma-70 factor (ECF subfamily)
MYQDFIHTEEESLIEEAQHGNSLATGRLVQLWYQKIYNYALKFLGSKELAAEVSQQTFISLHKNIHTLQDKSKFKPWIYTIVANKCREEARRKKRWRIFSFDQVLSGKVDADSPTWEISRPRDTNPESKYLQSEIGALLKNCIKKLPEGQREVLIMKEYEGLKFREIADILHISENTAKSRLYYAFDALRKMLKKENISKETVSYEF